MLGVALYVGASCYPLRRGLRGLVCVLVSAYARTSVSIIGYCGSVAAGGVRLLLWLARLFTAYTQHSALAVAAGMDPFAFASGGGRGATLKSPVVLQTLESENPLPEERKRIIEKWYEALQLLGMFDDALPPEHEFMYELTPLETTPVLTVSAEAGITQKDVDQAARARTTLQAENTRKQRTRDVLVRDLKAHVGLALLRAIEKNAPQLWKRMKRDHVLVAATADKPASYNGNG